MSSPDRIPSPDAPPQTDTAAPSTALFRPRAVARQHALIDAPLRLRARGLYRVSLWLLVLAGTGAVLLAQQPYREKLTVAGYVEHGERPIAVRANVSAVVQRLAVVEGDWVEAGEPLLWLGSDVRTASGDRGALVQAQALAQEAAALAAQRTLIGARFRAQQRLLQQRLRAQRGQGRFLDTALMVTRSQHDLTQAQLAKVALLAARGAVSPSAHDAERQRQLAAQRELLVAQRAVAEHRDRLADLARQLEEQQLARDESLAQLDADAARLQQRKIAHTLSAERLLVAPAAGYVAALLVRPGQRLQLHQRVLSLVASVPETAGAALLIPSRARGAVAPGQRVRLRYAGYPHQKYGVPEGRITQVSSAPVQGDDAIVAAGASGALYLARVSVSGPTDRSLAFDPAAAAPGMQLQADVIVRSDAIWQRLLEPLLTLWQRA